MSDVSTPVTTSKSERRKAAVAAGRVNPQQRSEHRRDPLPPGVWIVEQDRIYHALRVSAPGQVDLWDGSKRAPRPIRVATVKPGWWRRSRLRLIDDQGNKTVIRALPFGEAGMADVGVLASGGVGGGLLAGGDDIFGLILFLIWLVVVVVAAPFVIRRRFRCSRVAKDIRAAIKGKG